MVTSKYFMDEPETTSAPRKTGPKPKELIKVEVYGYEVGRGKTKRIVFDQDVFKLAAMGCTDREIAQWFDMSESTLRYNFSSIMEKGRTQLKQSLRQAMLYNAITNNNAAVQIFLAKNILGMTDQGMASENNQILPYTDDDSSIIEEDIKDTEDV